ncbi:MAG: potassium-transporting ATPase subunit F [Ignavibacteria bacterium]|nr:potassium-transporting ATPase subunit F [Ignavibacteria bacterium]
MAYLLFVLIKPERF